MKYDWEEKYSGISSNENKSPSGKIELLKNFLQEVANVKFTSKESYEKWSLEHFKARTLRDLSSLHYELKNYSAADHYKGDCAKFCKDQINFFKGLKRLSKTKCLARILPFLRTLIDVAVGEEHKWIISQISDALDNIDKINFEKAKLNGWESIEIGRWKHTSSIFKLVGIECFGNSPEYRDSIKKTMDAALTDIKILILGETGTGKELLARFIHNWSPRQDKEFVPINCSALPESLIESELFGHEKGAFTNAIKTRIGAFERARGGTFFLDEIGELSLTAQAKVLRAIENKEIQKVGGDGTIKVDARIIAATNKNLKDEVEKGFFRKDLYHRINEVPIRLPSLRERKEDIPELAYYFARRYRDECGSNKVNFSQGAIKKMQAYNWPGNIRELQNVVKRSLIYAKQPVVDEKDILFDIRPTIPRINSLKDIDNIKRNYLVSKLRYYNGNVSKLAKKEGIPRQTLVDMMDNLKIDRSMHKS